MTKWTKANPLAAVPGYKVPRGHFANGYTNGGDRVSFKVGGRVGLARGSGRTKRQAAASEIFKAKAKSKGGETDFDFSGYPQTSKYRKALTKHEKKFPKLTKNIEYNVSKLVPKYEKGPHKVKPSPRHTQKRADGGRIEFKRGGSPKNWIQKAVNPKHKGFCTPMTKKTCTPRRKALARTFKKMGKARKGK